MSLLQRNVVTIRLSVLCVVWTATVCLGQSYTITDLGTLGGLWSAARAINNLGQVVGWAENTEIGSNGYENRRAMLWLPVAAYGLPSGIHDLGTLGGDQAFAADINDHGVVVGTSAVDNNGWLRFGFRWEDGTLSNLGSPSGSELCGSRIFGINNRGAIVGGDNYCLWLYPILWLAESMYGFPAGRNELLSTPGIHSDGALLHDINDSGQIVGSNGLSDIWPSGAAFVWLPEPAYGLPAGVTNIAEVGDQGTTAHAINNAGRIVGYGSLVGHPGWKNAFVWENGQLDVLDKLAADAAAALGLNNQGTIVGWTLTEDAPWQSAYRACLWQDLQPVDLNDLVPLGSGWELTSAVDINDLGQIVGYGWIADEQHAFLLTPDCLELIPPIPDASAIPNNRYLSFAVRSVADSVALEVTLVEVPAFPSMNGTVRWVGPPATFADTGGQSTMVAAPLLCNPYFASFSALGAMQAYGPAIAPDATYSVRVVRQACDNTGLEFSDPLVIRTAKWGDIIAPFGGSSQPDFADVSAVVDGFIGTSNALSKTRTQLQPNETDPSTPVSFADISQDVDGFQGLPYPFLGPTSCPPS